MGEIKDLGINNIDDLKEKTNHQYKEFNFILKSNLDNKNDKIIKELFFYQKKMYFLHKDFLQSCGDADFFEAAKLAKQLISVKEAFESYLADQSFQSHFLSQIKKQGLSQSEQTKFAEITRKTEISQVPEPWQMAFAVARGRAILEKAIFSTNEYINTQDQFNARYKSAVDKVSQKNGIIDFEVTTGYKGEEYLYFNYFYRNLINIENGIIKAIYNHRINDTQHSGKSLPNSEILYNQLLLALRDSGNDLSKFHLAKVIQEKVANHETINTLDCCMKTLGKVQLASNSTYQFAKDSDQYYAMLGTPNVYGTLYLLKQHPKFFGEKKEITSIEIEKPEDSDKPTIILHIGERE